MCSPLISSSTFIRGSVQCIQHDFGLEPPEICGESGLLEVNYLRYFVTTMESCVINRPLSSATVSISVVSQPNPLKHNLMYSSMLFAFSSAFEVVLFSGGRQ